MTLYTVQPLSDVTWCGQEKREENPFRASWSNTLALLRHELEAIKARDVVLEVDVEPGQVRRDGMLRADAKVKGGAVRLMFDSVHGQQVHQLDKYTQKYYGDPPEWQINLRALALTLEALRKVARYGSSRGQQYAGYAALGAAQAMPASNMTREDAIAVLAGHVDVPPEHLNLDPDSLWGTWRRARRRAHPDRHGGDQTKWDQVEAAAQTLGLLS